MSIGVAQVNPIEPDVLHFHESAAVLPEYETIDWKPEDCTDEHGSSINVVCPGIKCTLRILKYLGL